MNKLLIIIPAYNEAGNIQSVIAELKKVSPSGLFDYVIINDGSSDNTLDICKERDFQFISMPINVGLSGVFRTGMKYAAQHHYMMAMQYDGDGQHDPKYIESLINYMELHSSDIVIGSRYVTSKKDLSFRGIGNTLLMFLIKITTGKKITDPTSGMRIYNEHMIQLFSRDINLPPEPDTIAYLIKCGYQIDEVQVEMRKRQGGTSYLTFGNALRYMLNMCISIIFIQRFRRKKK